MRHCVYIHTHTHTHTHTHIIHTYTKICLYLLNVICNFIFTFSRIYKKYILKFVIFKNIAIEKLYIFLYKYF